MSIVRAHITSGGYRWTASGAAAFAVTVASEAVHVYPLLIMQALAMDIVKHDRVHNGNCHCATTMHQDIATRQTGIWCHIP